MCAAATGHQRRPVAPLCCVVRTYLRVRGYNALERAPGSDSRAIRGKERCLQVIRAPQRRPYNLYFEAINYYYSYLRYCLLPRASS